MSPLISQGLGECLAHRSCSARASGVSRFPFKCMGKLVQEAECCLEAKKIVGLQACSVWFEFCLSIFLKKTIYKNQVDSNNET